MILLLEEEGKDAGNDDTSDGQGELGAINAGILVRLEGGVGGASVAAGGVLASSAVSNTSRAGGAVQVVGSSTGGAVVSGAADRATSRASIAS